MVVTLIRLYIYNPLFSNLKRERELHHRKILSVQVCIIKFNNYVFPHLHCTFKILNGFFHDSHLFVDSPVTIHQYCE